jgi:DNA-binding Lrp family transcriptional regulator
MQTEIYSGRSGRRVADTQQDAYHAMTVKELSAKQRMVLDAFEHGRPPMTREDIAAVTNLKLSSVCGRVRELLDAGRLAVVGSRKDLATQTKQQLLAVVPKAAA